MLALKRNTWKFLLSSFFFQVKMLKVKLLLKVLHLSMENFLKMEAAPQKWILKLKFSMRKSLSNLLRKVMVRSHPNTPHALVSPATRSCAFKVLLMILFKFNGCIKEN